MSERAWSGSCFCGAVRYTIRSPVKFVAHDHCSMCRRISGAAFVTWCGVREEQFSLDAGEGSVTQFASSAEATRSFCCTCGSHLFFRSTKWPGEVHVTLATILDPEGLTPRAHVYASDAAPFITIPDGLPRFGGVSGLEPL